MPFKPIDFAAIEPQGNPFLRDFVQNLAKGYETGQLPQKLERERQKEELANQLQKYLVQEEPEKFKSQMDTEAIQRAFQQAQTGKINTMTPLEAKELALKNSLYPELTRSKITNNLALAKQRETGLSGLGTGGREEYLFQHLTQQSNPNLKQEQIFDASNAIREGKTKLSDGTPINITPAMLGSLDRLTKYGSTGDVISNVIRGMQADKELGVINKYVGEAIAPYGDTIAGGYSVKQILDTGSNKKEDQINLGRLAAAQQLQTDAAANQNIINSGRPTASITREIMRDSETKIKTLWPKMSNVARQESLRYLKEVLDKTLEAKRSVGIGAFSAAMPSTETATENTEEQPKIDGKPVVKINGKWHYK